MDSSDLKRLCYGLSIICLILCAALIFVPPCSDVKKLRQFQIDVVQRGYATMDDGDFKWRDEK